MGLSKIISITHGLGAPPQLEWWNVETPGVNKKNRLYAQHTVIKPPAQKSNKFRRLKKQSTTLNVPLFRAD
jgi:hypothetical protein